MTPHRSRIFCSRLLAVAICLALAGCSSQAPPAGGTPATPAAAAPPAAQAGQLAEVSATDLRKRAQLALREQRVFAPAGDNAIEFYVALLGRSGAPDADAQGALMELQPYAVIGAEQALARGDVVEAERLRRLVAAFDPAAPSLVRLADAIRAKVGAQAQAPIEQAVGIEMPSKIEPVVQSAIQAPSRPAPSATAPVTLATPGPPPPPAPVTVPVPAAPVASAGRATPIQAQELIPVRTPQPEYPASTRRSGATGQVVASFTVLSDGSIGTVGVESVGERQLAFERSVVAAVKRWKYQPPGEARNVRMNFAFAP